MHSLPCKFLKSVKEIPNLQRHSSANYCPNNPPNTFFIKPLYNFFNCTLFNNDISISQHNSAAFCLSKQPVDCSRFSPPYFLSHKPDLLMFPCNSPHNFLSVVSAAACHNNQFILPAKLGQTCIQCLCNAFSLIVGTDAN